MNPYPGDRPDLQRIMEGASHARAAHGAKHGKDNQILKDLCEAAHYAFWAEAQIPKWHPISTLPPDEEVVVLCSSGLHIGRYTSWNGKEYEWMIDGELSDRVPTHWTPLPEMP